MDDIPDQVTIRFDIRPIGNQTGNWKLDLPIDLAAAKALARIINLNNRYESPYGFQIDFLQLRHVPSKSELVFRVNDRVRGTEANCCSPHIRYQIKNEEGRIVAAWDGLIGTVMLKKENTLLENNGLVPSQMGHRGEGYWIQRHPFIPLSHTGNLELELVTVYAPERTEASSIRRTG